MGSESSEYPLGNLRQAKCLVRIPSLDLKYKKQRPLWGTFRLSLFIEVAPQIKFLLLLFSPTDLQAMYINSLLPTNLP